MSVARVRASFGERTRMFRELGAKSVVFAAGEVVITQGESPRAMYLVQRGVLVVSALDEDGAAHMLATVGPGAILGEVSMLQEGPATASVRAQSEATLLGLSEDTFEKLAGERTTAFESLLLELGLSVSSHLANNTEMALRTLRQELEISKLGRVMASFIIYVMLGLASYAFLVKYLADRDVRLEHAAIVSGPIMLLMSVASIVWIRRSGFPREIFGLTLRDWPRHAVEGVVWSLPVLALLAGLKYSMISQSGSLAGEPFSPVLSEPFRVGPAIGNLVYIALVPMQEFVARGVIQGPLYEFMSGPSKRRWLWSIVVSNALFGVTHLHLTIPYGLAALAGGVLWGVLFARQRSLVGPAVSHILIGVFALYFLGFANILKGIGG